MPIKSDTIRDKGVHIKLDRETHVNFKLELVKRGLSMQEAFAEFARLIGTGSPSAHALLNRLIREQLRQELTTVGLKLGPRRRNRRIDELDTDRLYDLINEGNQDDEAV